MFGSIIIKLLAIAVGTLLLLRLIMIAPGIPISLLTQPPPENPDLEKAIKANPKHAFAHERLAKLALKKDKIELAKNHALKALTYNPSSGIAMSVLIDVYDKQGNEEKAHQAAQLAAHLWPAHDSSMNQVANYWMKAGHAGKALAAWNVMLIQNPVNEDEPSNWATRKVFPILHALAQHEESSQLFQSLHADPPSWWNDFFRYLTRQDNNFVTVDRFYQQSKLNSNHNEKTHKLYLGYLMKESRWEQAHEEWLSSQDKDAQNMARLIYDGGFEGNVFNNEFSWNITKKDNVQAYLDKFSRANGSYSLRVAFNNWLDDYWGYIQQLLVLKPGDYTLQFQTRANLNAEKGLKWLIYCVKGTDKYKKGIQQHKLASTELLAGSFKWRQEKLDFTIPDDPDCKAQTLFLITAGANSSEKRIRGDIWFDDFEIISHEE